MNNTIFRVTTRMHLYLTAFLLGVILFHASPTTAGLIRHIINGIDSQPDQWPFMAALHRITEDKQSKRNYEFFCGAVIWDKQTILTAAHCLEGEHADQIAVFLGNVNRMNINAGYLYEVKQIIIHNKYENYLEYDIALLRLATPINFTTASNKIAPVLRPESSQLVNSKRCMVLGWGLTELVDSYSQQVLREADVSLESCYPQCQIQKSGHIKAGNIGANKGTCYGDSGGPLLCALPDEPLSYCLVGITSYSNGPCKSGKITALSTYTYVPHYLDWIIWRTDKNSFPEARQCSELLQEFCIGWYKYLESSAHEKNSGFLSFALSILVLLLSNFLLNHF